MATQLQIRRGTSTQVAAFTGAEGEIVVNTTNDSVHVNDGSTAGGFELARADLNNVSDTDLNAALTGNTVSALTITTLTLGATAITATGAELNILDGVTSTAAELNILDGVTSTTAELNILDGVTATTAELNYVDGVTSAIQTQIDTKAPLASPTFTGTATMGGLEIATSASDIGVDLKLDGNKTSNGAIGSIIFENNGDSVGMIRSNRASANDAADMLFYTQATGGANTQRMAITKDGNVLVGTSVAHLTSSTFSGYTQFAGGHSIQKRSGGIVAYYDRLTDDGDIMQFRRQGTTVGSIGAYDGRPYLASSTVGIRISNALFPSNTSGVITDGAMNIGSSSGRFKDLYLSGGAYLGGTGSANKLDDYEEGTWTPTAGISLSVNYSTYTKIGDLVFINVDLLVASGSTSGSSFGISLPFASADTYQAGAFSYQTSGFNDATVNISTTIGFRTAQSGSNMTFAQAQGKRLIFSATYKTTA